MQPLDDFLAKTHAQLVDLVREAGNIRRTMPTRHTCGACRPCVQLATIHRRIDDHLNQLDIAALDPDPEPVHCVACGRRRYTNGATTVCAACDGLPGSMTTWSAVPDRD